MKYRKKPIVIEAFQMTYERRWDNKDWPNWLNAAWQKDAGVEGALYIDDSVDALPGERERSALCIGTLEGPLKISWDDYIIRGIESEIYPCKEDIFEKTYDDVEAEPFIDAHAQFDRVQAKACDETSVVTPFECAVAVILGEREYQERLWGPTEMQGKHSTTEFLVFIRDYVEEALHIQSRIASPAAENKTRHTMRKIAALAIACMEQNGVAHRGVINLDEHREKHCISG